MTIGPHHPQHDAIPSGRPEHYLKGRRRALTALAERGSPAWHRSFEEGPIIGTCPDDGMCSARHLGGDSSQRLTLQIGIVTIACNVALVLGSETVVALANGDLCRDPERTPKTRVAELGELRLAAELARLVGRQVEATELQELAVMTEAS